MITDISARLGSPSQLIRAWMRPSWNRVQLMTLKVGSNIHFQAKVESTVGMINGSRMNARVNALPLKWRLSSKASHSPKPSLKTVATAVYTKVFQTAVRKMLSSNNASKFARPTKEPGTPTLASVTDSSTPSTNG